MATKTNKKANVPNLRFSGFQDEWENKRLGDIIEFKAGYAFPSNGMLNEKSTYQLIKMSNVYRNELRLDRNPSFWPEVDAKQREFILKKGDTVLTLTGTVGKKDFGYSVQITEGDKYLLNQRLVLLREKKNKSANDFINQLVSNEKFLGDFFETAKGGTGNQTNVGIEDVKNLTFFFPSDTEQRKIAAFLSVIDKRIQTQNKIIEDLELLKRTISNRIFEQKLRFKNNGSHEYPAWKIKNLEEVCEIVGGGTPETSKSEYWNGDIQWFTPTEIKTNYVEKSTRTITVLGLKSSSAKLLPKGTILLTTRATIGEVAIALAECSTNQGFQSLVVKEGANNVFIFNWLKEHKHELVKRANGSTFAEVSKSEIEKIPISIPSLSEQTKIASCISSIDDKVEIERILLRKWEQQKKILLKKLFI